ncbi:hypothetical protein NDU88_008685 [Pleurodeles waltl]|uniref:Uncharacterized protein n=1 Tax=Pleurodeles waltl TaxID=8319 RepID=A0AAV7RYD1_PLEWA|nr:hypothetical protein NDU88_008685 [Pleurodeles waltl]
MEKCLHSLRLNAGVLGGADTTSMHQKFCCPIRNPGDKAQLQKRGLRRRRCAHRWDLVEDSCGTDRDTPMVLEYPGIYKHIAGPYKMAPAIAMTRYVRVSWHNI